MPNSIEKRVAALEQEVASLRAAVSGNGDPAWRRTFGMFAGDEVMKRILDHALAYREADRRRTRPKPATGRRAKK